MSSTNNNAITVSYGSFSVTLSGHEKPFELLKQVTDYYSHLAISNPNFGAMPMVSTMEASTAITPELSQKTPTQAVDSKQETINTAQSNGEAEENTDNLWQEPLKAYDGEPLVLNAPLKSATSAEETLIAAADQALSAPELAPDTTPEQTNPRSKFLTSNYPFRHFPLRRPGRS